MKKIQFQEQYGPWAIVAGASEGLGATYAEQLASNGLHVFLIARREDKLHQLAQALTGKYHIQVKTLALDLSLPTSPETILQATQGLEIGLLVYNAAFSAVGAFQNRSLEDHMREVDTNIRTPLALIHSLGTQMLVRKRGGILLMSSLSAFQGSAFISNYAATKAYSIMLAEGLWEEWRQQGVDVLVCVASAIRTPNYLASAPQQTSSVANATLEPLTVVQEALAALGKQPYVIPGRVNRIYSFMMRHLMPRRMTIQMMGNILRNMYQE
jgi:short-subunit dehydrogenase